MLGKSSFPVRAMHYRRSEDDEVVQTGLAVTPAQMSEMVSRGIPVSTTNLGNQFYDGRPSSDFEVDPIYRRGVDIADVFEAQEDSKHKIRQGMRKLKVSPNPTEYGAN